MENIPQKNSISKKVLTGIYFAPAALIAWSVFAFGVPFPFSDQWGFAIGYLDPYVQGKSSLFAIAWQQANDSRPFFPALLYLKMASFSGWRIGFELAIVFFAAVIIGLCAIYIFVRSAKRHFSIINHICAFLALCFVFSPYAYENWLWGITFVNLSVPLCLVLGLALYVSPAGERSYFLLSGLTILAVFGTFSFANGLFLWPLFFLLLLKRSYPFTRASFVRILFFLLIAMAAAGIFALGYSGLHLSPPTEPLTMRIQRIGYGALAFLGAPLGCFQMSYSSIWGGAGIALLLAMFVLSRKGRPNQRHTLFHDEAVIALVMAGYTVASALAVAYGRGHLSTEAVLASRYGCTNIWLWIAILLLSSHLAARSGERAMDRCHLPNFRYALYGMLSLLFVSHCVTSWQSFDRMRSLHRFQLREKASVVLLERMPLISPISATPATATLRWKTYMDEQGLLSLINRLRQSKLWPHPPFLHSMLCFNSDGIEGALTSISEDANRGTELTGWAWLSAKKRSPEAIIITDKAMEPICATIMTCEPVSAEVGVNGHQNCEWRVILPREIDEVLLFAFDASSNLAVKFAEARLGGQSATENKAD